MTPDSQAKFKKIKELYLSIFRTSAEHLFLTIIFLVFVSLFLGLAVFYKYGVLPQKVEPELGEGLIKFEEGIYQKILREWESREERFEAAKTKQRPDLFR